MSAAPQQFTAARIAEVLGKSPRVVRRWLSGIAPDGEIMVRGNLASAWKAESLPAHAIQELTSTANAKGYRFIDNLLSGRVDAWQPEIPWNEICPGQQAEALAIQRALMPLIQRRNETGLAVAEFETLGAQTYQRETGKEITCERWRYIFNRTIERDGGAAQFHRPELFLNGNLRKAVPIAPAGAGVEDFEPLNTFMAQFRDPIHPSGEEIDALWIEIAELFVELSENENPKKLKRRLLDFLSGRAPFLAANANALRVNFDRKLKKFQVSEGDATVLIDGRELKRGEKRAPEIPQDDIDRTVWHSARKCGNRTAQAVRELVAMGDRSGLTPQTMELITRPAASKSHVNRRFFSAVHPVVKMIAPFLLGKKAKDDATPSLQRDYSKLHSMDSVTGDDFTFPVYCYVPDGNGWWILTRGQALMTVDCRSLKILAYSFQPERNYNSLVIRTLMNQTCSEHGVPREWYFENGQWKNARVVKGAPPGWNESKSQAELITGWTKLGVKFTHAKTARAKLAERAGELLQDLMERIPGYCGRDERRDCPEETKRNKLAVEARRVEPCGLFLSFDAWHSELGKLIETYNGNVQQGRIIDNLSPDQAFEAYWPKDNPPIKLSASCWHLLAHYVSERPVGVDGIKFKIGGKDYIYRDENSSDLRGKTVLAWFDPECPELLGVTNMKGRDPRLIQRANAVEFQAALDKESDSYATFQTELSKVAGHNAYPKARYKVLSAKFKPTFRGNLVAHGVAHTAETFQAVRAAIQEREQQKTERASTRTKRARKIGLQPSAVRGDAMGDEGLDMVQRALAAEEKKSKTYVLDPHKTFTPKNNGGNQ